MRIKAIVALLVVLLSLGGASCAPLGEPSAAPTEEPVEFTVYFTDSDVYAQGTAPFEAPVTRSVDASANLPEAVLFAFFAGPTEEERDQGLERINSGFTGFTSLTIDDGIARVYLTGECESSGATYTIAQPITKNLLQFPSVDYVKIYDEHGNTQLPEGQSNSIPARLEP